MSDTVKGQPLFPVGAKVTSHVFFDPDTPKTVCTAWWDGCEYRYAVEDAEGVTDCGYLAKDFELWEEGYGA